MSICVGIDRSDIEWRKLPNHPAFDISNYGDVRRRINVTHPERNRPFTYIKPEIDKDGYLRVQLERKHHVVHRLVYSIFCGDLVEGLVVCHDDNNRSNNYYKNLLQETQKTNISHKIKHGTRQIGEKHGKSIYTTKQVAEVKAEIIFLKSLYPEKLPNGTCTKLCAKHGVRRDLINDVSSGKSWQHV